MTPRTKKNMDNFVSFVSNWKTISTTIISALLFIGSSAEGYITDIVEPIIEQKQMEQSATYDSMLNERDRLHKIYLSRMAARLEMAQIGYESKAKGMKGARERKRMENKIAEEYLNIMEGE